MSPGLEKFPFGIHQAIFEASGKKGYFWNSSKNDLKDLSLYL